MNQFTRGMVAGACCTIAGIIITSPDLRKIAFQGPEIYEEVDAIGDDGRLWVSATWKIKAGCSATIPKAIFRWSDSIYIQASEGGASVRFRRPSDARIQ